MLVELGSCFVEFLVVVVFVFLGIMLIYIIGSRVNFVLIRILRGSFLKEFVDIWSKEVRLILR